LDGKRLEYGLVFTAIKLSSTSWMEKEEWSRTLFL